MNSKTTPSVVSLTSSGLLPTNLPLLPRLLQLLISLGVDLSLAPGEHVPWRDVADGAIQTGIFVMLDITFHQMPGIF